MDNKRVLEELLREKEQDPKDRLRGLLSGLEFGAAYATANFSPLLSTTLLTLGVASLANHLCSLPRKFQEDAQVTMTQYVGVAASAQAALYHMLSAANQESPEYLLPAVLGAALVTRLTIEAEANYMMVQDERDELIRRRS